MPISARRTHEGFFSCASIATMRTNGGIGKKDDSVKATKESALVACL
jgi:hypothetical protein